tara:strand:+ start:657 stop:941 length:285 start_codon:yes stop_codon:yes gene_type:complete
MTIQELIDELEYSIKELEFNPNAKILIDIVENVDGLTEQTSEVLVDNDSSCKDLLSINAYIKEEKIVRTSRRILYRIKYYIQRIKLWKMEKNNG